MNKIKDYLSDYKWKEHNRSYGFQNSEKVFLVIRRRSKAVGLFSYILTALGYMKIAEEKQYIPVVDLLNNKNPYIDIQNKRNVWEYYFEQPSNITLDDIKHSKHVILSNGEPPKDYPDILMFSNLDNLALWRNLYHKYVRLNKETESYIHNVEKELFKGERILGVLCRGTDYRNLKPKGHPIQPDVRDVIELAHKAMEEQNCDKIYLATEDKEILEEFRNTFAEKLLFPDVQLRNYEDRKLITLIETNRKDDRRMKGLEYLTQIALLSRCNCFIGSGCGGTYGALLMSDGFEWQYLWNLGLY